MKNPLSSKIAVRIAFSEYIVVPSLFSELLSWTVFPIKIGEG